MTDFRVLCAVLVEILDELNCNFNIPNQSALIERARAVLARWGRPTIEPVPVAERPWEREGWCDAEERCWFYWPEWSNENGDVVVLEPPMWEFRKPEALEVYPFSLPHHALPVPQP